MRNLAITLFFATVTVLPCCTNAQTTSSETTKAQNHLEVMFLPTPLYSSFSLGYSVKGQNIEHNIEFYSGLYTLGNPNLGVALHVNRNYYFNQNEESLFKWYIPVWVGARNVTLAYDNYEDGGPNYDWFNIRTGSGVGCLMDFGGRSKLRTELGVGTALLMHDHSSASGEKNLAQEIKTDHGNLKPVEKYPVVPAFRLRIRYLIQIK